MTDTLVTVARIIKPFGLRGRIVVESLTDFPDRFAPGSILLLDNHPFEITAGRPQKHRWVLKLKGVNTPEDAEALRGAFLQVPESDLHPLPQGQFYRFQLIGLLAVTRDGKVIGTITDVLETPANDVYQVQTPAGERLIPALPDFVVEIDLEAGRMVIEEIQTV